MTSSPPCPQKTNSIFNGDHYSRITNMSAFLSSLFQTFHPVFSKSFRVVFSKRFRVLEYLIFLRTSAYF
jgi:hypothetical protein